MHFHLTPDQEMVRDTARRFAREELIPNAARWDEAREFPLEAVRKLGELGFLGMMTDPAWHGAGLDAVSYALVVEEISRGCASTGVILSVNNSLVCYPLEKFGDDGQKERYLRPLASGKMLGAYCLTEPMAGSDAGATRTTIAEDGDDLILNGTKSFVTNGGQADLYLVYATTSVERKARGITALLVESDLDGVEPGTRERTLGIRASSTREMRFHDVRVPRSNVLGGMNRGFRVAVDTLDGGRIGIAAQAVGIARAAFEEAVEYARTRRQFDKPIASFEAIQIKLAEMSARLEAARLMTVKAAWLQDQGREYGFAASAAKLLASRAAVETANDALQIHGGYGYTADYPVERHYRDAKITEIYEGTSEMQQLNIARGVLR